MASVKKYSTGSGETRWMVRYRRPDRGTTMKRGFKTKKLADAYANTVEVAKMTGAYVAPSLGRITVAELAPEWLIRKQQACAASHFRMLESAWRVHVQPRWGATPVADIDQLAVEAWITRMGRSGSGATTVLRAHGVLSGVLADAVKAKRLTANPCRAVEGLPHKTAKRRVYLTADDVERLAKEAEQHRPLVLVLAYCGLRWGEAIALRVRDIEFLRRRINIHENAVQLGVEHAVGAPKSRKARSVPIPDFVANELAPLCGGKTGGDLVFPAPDGGYLPRSKTSGGWFQGAVTRAGIQRVTPHDLRHTCASLSVSAGVNVLALQRMLGHTSAKVTLDTYADLFDTDLDAVAASLHAAYSTGSALKTCSLGGN